jgi:NTP pyrophosphatase (non-canonical NTP hydrolase)|tara:strand:- start:710 stop:967 length:258 start_codon:yes stop_codon:yes gene_type:complete
MRTKLEQLMIITMEECGELIQACSKKIRGSKTANKLLLEEVGDVQCMIDLIVENGLLAREDVSSRVQVKRDKLKRWSDLIEDSKR